MLSSVLNLDLEYGWTVGIYTPRPNLVGVFSQITGARITDYNCTDNTIIYEVTKDGLILKNKQDFNVKDVLCSANDSFVKQYLDEYIANVSDEELEYLRKNTKIKYEVVSAYNLLSSEDKSAYSEFINNLLKGKAPVISAKNDKITIKQGAKIDLYGLVSISDFADFVIDVDSDFVKIETSLNTKVAGEYDVVYSVKDSSGNNVTKTIKVVVEKDEEFEEEQIKDGLKTILIVASIIVVFVVIMIIVLKITKKEKSKGKKKVN